MNSLRKLIIISLSFLAVICSCEKDDNLPDNYFIINGEKIEIDTALIRLREGEIDFGFIDFRIAFYSEGVNFYKNQAGYDSLTYEENSVKVYYWLGKPEKTNEFTGSFYYSPDSSFNFEQTGYYKNGSNYIADSGEIRIIESNGNFNIDFEFYNTWPPDSIDIKGKYNGQIQIDYD